MRNSYYRKVFSVQEIITKGGIFSIWKYASLLTLRKLNYWQWIACVTLSVDFQFPDMPVFLEIQADKYAGKRDHKEQKCRAGTLT